MLAAMPCPSSTPVYSAQAYCTTRSEWWTRLPQGGRARRHRHGQRRHRQAGAEMIGHRPADDAPAESIEDNRQIGELLLEPGIEPAPAKAGVMSATHSWSRALS